MQHRIKVVPYDSQWPIYFASEAALIKQALGENCIDVYHIGSTSVPELAAKPVIDMMPAVADITQVDNANPAIQQLGYKAMGENGMPFRRYFKKYVENLAYHVHVFEANSPEIDRHIKFRDWLRTNPGDRQAYATLKQNLAVEHPHDINAYCRGKDHFITDIDHKSGFADLRVVKALTPREWAAVRHFRQFYFFDKLSISDPYTWTFNDPQHVHFVLYKGVELIGYTHLQLWPDERAAMRIIVVDEPYRNQGIGTHLLKLCERWLTQQGFHFLQLESSKAAKNFYKKHGYVEMPFNDPEGNQSHPDDTALGKTLK